MAGLREMINFFSGLFVPGSGDRVIEFVDKQEKGRRDVQFSSNLCQLINEKLQFCGVPLNNFILVSVTVCLVSIFL